MRAPGLYAKLLLSFLGLLLLLQLLVMGSFLLLDERPPHRQLDSHLRGLALFSQRLAQERLAQARERGQAPAEVLEALSHELAETVTGRVWFEAGGRIVAQSFAGEPPRVGPPPGRPPGPPGPFRMLPQPPREVIIEVPLAAPDLARPRMYLLLVHPPTPPPPRSDFLLRLALICLLVALVVVPVSRFIARPIKRLRDSALKIAEGDLRHRATLNSRDEIGELARSLNYMTDRLQQMILASRELLAYVSHQLRSPLARIMVAGQLLADRLGGRVPAEASGYLGAMREDIQQMDELLARILLLSRLEMQQGPARREAVDLAEMVRQQAERVSPLLRHRNLELRLDLVGPAILTADGEALATALANLLENAAKHSLAPGLVRVGLAAQEGTWRLTVENPAAALTPAELETIFLPFQRAEGTQAEGSGLGLALAKKIIEAQGGAIRASYLPPNLRIEVILPGQA